MELRQYQIKAINAIRDTFSKSRAVAFCLPTGGGKTVIACEVMRRTIATGRRVLFLVHRVELVEQARDRLAAFGIKAGIIKAGFSEDRTLPVQVACIPTLIRREFPHADLIILDECHHVASESWHRVVAHYRDAGAFTLGISATMCRLDGKPLAGAFDTIIEPVTTAELVQGGFLIAPNVYAPSACDRKGLRTVGGDYSLPQLAERMEPLTGSITEYWSRYCRGKRTLAFAVNVKHSRQIEDALRALGARVTHIDGTSSKEERAAANQMLRAHELDVVTQVSVWTEGLDIPEIECLIVARPTKSLGLHRQICGRVMRPAPGKTRALILDHAGNHHEHGMVTDPVTWSLDGKPKKERATPTRQCSECFAIYDASLPACPECDAVPEPNENVNSPGVENEGELEEFKSRESKAEWYRETVRDASRSWYAIGWARMRYKAKFGTFPRFPEIEEQEYDCSKHNPVVTAYGPRRVMRCAKCCRSTEVAYG